MDDALEGVPEEQEGMSEWWVDGMVGFDSYRADVHGTYLVDCLVLIAGVSQVLVDHAQVDGAVRICNAQSATPPGSRSWC